MLKRLLAIFLFTSALARAADRPSLVVLIVIDQLRSDYLDRFNADFKSGLKQLLDEGYRVPGFHDHAATMTAPGHVLVGSGLSPSQSGIVSNSWYQPSEGKVVIGAEVLPSSDTVRLRWFNPRYRSFAQRWHERFPHSRVISVSQKDRGAVLFTGPGQNQAVWWDKTLGWRSYPHEWPWFESVLSEPFRSSIKMDALEKSRVRDEQALAFALALVSREKLGRLSTPDVLTLSLSSLDHAGHEVGPHGVEVQTTLLRIDQALGVFLNRLSRDLPGQVRVVLSSDHGVTPPPEESRGKGFDAGRLAFFKDTIPNPDMVRVIAHPFVYLNERATDRRAVSEGFAALPGVARVYDIGFDATAIDRLPDHVQKNRYCPRIDDCRTGDLQVELKPKWIFMRKQTGTTHGQPSEDDRQVPMLFWGAGVSHGVHPTLESVGRIAPTVLKEFEIDTQGLLPPLTLPSSR